MLKGGGGGVHRLAAGGRMRVVSKEDAEQERNLSKYWSGTILQEKAGEGQFRDPLTHFLHKKSSARDR